MEKNVPGGIPMTKAYDIRLHTMATNECQDLDSKIVENANQSLSQMKTVYDKSFQDV